MISEEQLEGLLITRFVVEFWIATVVVTERAINLLKYSCKNNTILTLQRYSQK